MLCGPQAYVAISRATSIDGLEIQNFQPKAQVKTSELVREFYEAIDAGKHDAFVRRAGKRPIRILIPLEKWHTNACTENTNACKET